MNSAKPDLDFQEPTRPLIGFKPYITPSVYLTADVPGVGGVIKQRPEDFLVEEIPAYEPAGDGEHIYLFIEKRDLSTLHVVRILADHFGVKRDAVGFAGLKDKRALTRQHFSVHVPGKLPADFPALQHPQLVVHWVDQHTNKLRRGHLKANRFVIRIRNVEPGKVTHVARGLRLLQRLGMPNRIGPQRFGSLVRNHTLGRAIVKADSSGMLLELLSLPRNHDGSLAPCPASQLRFREMFELGDYPQAFAVCPRSLSSERRVLAALARGVKPTSAAFQIGRTEMSFAVAAMQSAMFNRLLDDRLAAGTFGQLEPGDLAFKHDSGAVFPIDDQMLQVAAGQEPVDSLAQRLSRLEISPSGPMWGAGMTTAAGIVGERELDVLTSAGISRDDLHALEQRGIDGSAGQRRPFRVPIMYPDLEAGVDEHGPYIRCTFELPRGAFATSLMEELMKNGPAGLDAPYDQPHTQAMPSASAPASDATSQHKDQDAQTDQNADTESDE